VALVGPPVIVSGCGVSAACAWVIASVEGSAKPAITPTANATGRPRFTTYSAYVRHELALTGRKSRMI
jgi:hypothetical protein